MSGAFQESDFVAGRVWPTGDDLEPKVLFTKRTIGSKCLFMPQPPLFSRADLCALARVPDDAVVFWLRHELVRSAEREGRAHRRFDKRELKIAAFLREARRNGMNVSAMKQITAKLRDALDIYNSFSRFNLTPMQLFSALTFARVQNKESRGMMLADGSSDPDIQQKISDAIAAMDSKSRTALTIAFDFVAESGTWLVYITEDGEWMLEAGITRISELPAASAIIFDLSRTCSIDWSYAREM